MIKNTVNVLKNGLKVVLCENLSKNQTTIQFFINYGGKNLEYEVDNETYHIKQGTAHLLEHYVCESSIYGNLSDYYRDKHVNHNAFTNGKYTSYYINFVGNFNERFKEILNVVNKPIFSKENLDIIKPPVLQEIKKDEDRVVFNFTKEYFNSINITNKFYSVLGTVEDIEQVSIEELKRIYDTFYAPNNQLLYISGNFESEEVLKQIEAYYDELNKSNVEFKILDLESSAKINVPFKEITTDKDDDLVRFAYKIDVTNISNEDRNYLTYYLSYFLRKNYDKASDAYISLKEKDLLRYGISTYYYYSGNLLYINIDYYGTYYDEYKVIQDGIMSKLDKLDEKYLKTCIKDSSIELINESSLFFKRCNRFASNVMDFDYYEEDNVEKVSYDNMLRLEEIFRNLDFSNNLVIIQTKNNQV